MAATLKGRFPVSKPTEVVKGDAKGKAPRTGRGVAVQQDDAEAKFERDKHELMLFDFDSRYGPYLGMTRLERWERAQKNGLSPPLRIKQLLEQCDDRLKMSVFEGRV